MQNTKEEGTVLDSIVTVTDWIIKQTVDFTSKNYHKFLKSNIDNISI